MRIIYGIRTKEAMERLSYVGCEECAVETR